MIIQMNKSLCPAAGELAAPSCSSITVYWIKEKLSEKELNQHAVHKNKSRVWSKMLKQTNTTADVQSNHPSLNVWSYKDITNGCNSFDSSKIYVTLLCLPIKIQTVSVLF